MKGLRSTKQSAREEEEGLFSEGRAAEEAEAEGRGEDEDNGDRESLVVAVAVAVVAPGLRWRRETAAESAGASDAALRVGAPESLKKERIAESRAKTSWWW